MEFKGDNSEKLVKTLEWFLSLHEADEIANMILDDKSEAQDIEQKLSEYLEQNYIKTNKFKDENALNLFITNVVDCRNAQKEVQKHLEGESETPDYEGKYKDLNNAQITFEEQLDRELAALPPIHALFL